MIILQVSITSSTLLWDPYSLGVSRIVAQAISILPIKKYPWTLPLSNLPKFPTPHISPLLLPSPVLRVHPPPCNPWGARYTGRMPRIWRRHVPAADWLVCSGHMSLTSGENHRRLPNWLGFGDPTAKILPLEKKTRKRTRQGRKILWYLTGIDVFFFKPDSKIFGTWKRWKEAFQRVTQIKCWASWRCSTQVQRRTLLGV